ncbi:hypothetical protein K3M35_05010 [Rhodococcus sp. DMU2021]|uniref:DUF7257 domain-containing protein n=1 Tax=Rhodococcus sp. DMU2021 TaxID=2866997 RepID=UPI001C7CC536|nr:hypothetical protein [Rhodococcus sp. DMU2021]MBX4168026.1 hypothetical protein [Rhodococcus sp. DMU2021]
MTYPGTLTFPGLLTFPGTWELTWPPPGIVPVSVARRPQVTVSVAPRGSVPARVPWRPQVDVEIPLVVSLSVRSFPEMRADVAVPLNMRVDYVADAIGGSVAMTVDVSLPVEVGLSSFPSFIPVVSLPVEVQAWTTITGSSDTFNRADGVLGSGWQSFSMAPVIAGNKAQAGSGGSNNTTNVHSALNALSLPGLDQEVQFTIAAPVGTLDSDRGVGALVRGTGTAQRTYVVGGVTGSAAYINTYQNGTATQVANRTGLAFSVGNTFVFRAQGNKYMLLRDGVEILVWTDSSNAFPVDSTFVRWGFEVANVKSFYSTSYGFAVDTISGRTLE